MTTNEIYQSIDNETKACVEKEYKLLKFKPRRAYEPECRIVATANHQSELDLINNENNYTSKFINDKIINSNYDIVVLSIGLMVVFGVIYYIFFNK